MKLIILLAVTVITSGLAGNAFLSLSKHCKGAAAHALTSLFWFAPLSLIFFIAARLGGGLDVAPSVLLPALLGGISSALSAFILLGSFGGNSFSTAIIIMNLNFVVPVIFSSIFLGETAAPVQLIGITLAVAVIIAVNYTGGDNIKPHAVLIPAAASLANGMVNSAIKLQQFYTPGQGENSYFAFEYLFAAIAALLIFALVPKAEKAKMNARDYGGCIIPAMSVGLCNGVTFYTVSLVSPMLNAAAQFTIITSLSLLLSLVVGFTLQGDKFTKKTAISIVCCAGAVACQCIGLM